MYRRRRICLGVLVSTISAVVPAAATEPIAEWRQYATPEEAGFASERLDEARRIAEKSDSAAVLLVYRGHVLAAWGDVSRPFKCHSVRKSLLSALYGIAVDQGKIDLTRTLADLGVDDQPPLTETEKRATVRDLIMARSGVYHRAAYEPSSMSRRRPERNSHQPGEHFWYNNWDFNTAGAVFERELGATVFESFKAWIAEPIGMEDFRLDRMLDHREPCASKYPAYLFRLSARDLARFGWLYACDGKWNGRQVVPAAWVEESTKPHSDAGRRGFYGYMWWVSPAGTPGDMVPTLSKYDKFIASGTGSQWLLVVPEAEFVFVNRGDTDLDPQGPDVPAWRIAERILAARTGEPKDKPALRAVQPVPFTGASPAPPTRKIVDVDGNVLAEYAGKYKSEEMEVDVHLHDDRLFVLAPGEGEAELVAESNRTFFSRTVPLQVTFESDAAGNISAASIRFGRESMRLPRAAE